MLFSAPIVRGLCVRRPSFCLQNCQIMVIYSKIKKCHGLCSLGLGKLMSTCSNLVTIFLISEVEKWEHNIHYPSNINSVMKNSFKHIGAWILLGALFDMKYKTKKCTFKTLLDQKDGLAPFFREKVHLTIRTF